MRIVKSNDPSLKIEVPPGSAFSCETPPLMPKAHFLLAVVGPRGSGKGVATQNFLMKLKCVDRLFYISPSANSNSVLLSRLGGMLQPNDMYSDVQNVKILDEIVSKIEAERDDLEEYWRKLDAYKRALRKVNSMKHDIMGIPDEEMYALGAGPPKHKWGGRPPCCVVWFDDIIGSNLMSGRGAREIARLAMFHRHIGGYTDPKRPGALGVSLIFNVQAWRSSAGAIPKAVRNNLTLMFLFKTKSDRELKEIAEEFGSEVSEETFRKVYRYATEGRHNFLWLDTSPKDNHPSPFRKNFSDFIVVEE